MSESMPIMANSSAGEQLKSMAGQTEAAADPATGDFGNLLDEQLQIAGENPSAFPTELLNITNDTELLTAVPASGMASGNDLPLTAATPGAAVIASPELLSQPPLQPATGSAATLPASAQESAVKSMQAINTSNELNPALNPDKANMDEMLMARQQQHLLQTAASSKDSTLFDSAMNQPSINDPASPSHSSSSMNNMMNVASLSAGLGAKADNVPGLTPAPLTVPPQHPGWNQSVGDRLQWMVGQNIQSADIRLDPPELGSMEVRIQINKDHANVVFSAPNPQVRDALESAIPRLREMMSDIGLSLGDVNVSQESFTQQQQADAESTASAGSTPGSDEPGSHGLEALTSTVPRQGQGLLDAYA